MTLVALFAISTGAWAAGKVYTSAVDITALQVGDILTEGASITGSGSIIFDNNRVKVNGTLQTDGFCYLYTNDFDSFGAEGVISLKNNTTMSPVDKDNNDGNAWEVTQVSFAENNNRINIQGITYAPAGIEVNGPTIVEGKPQWTFAMPAGDVELQVEYYPGMLTLPASLTGGTLSVVGLTAPFTKLEVPATWENDNTLLSAAHLPGLKEMTDAEAEKWTDAPNGYVILIYGFDGTKAKTATYLLGKFSNASPEDVKLSQLKTASAEAEIYYSSEAQMPAGFETDGKNIYVADKTEFQVKATPADGFRLVSLMFGEQDITDQVDADGIATLTMPEGNADITLTATFSDMYTVTLNAEGLTDEEAANWKAATGDKAPAAFPLENVKYGTEVKVTYGGTKKVIGVKAAKKVEPKKLTVGNVTFYYDEGQTFTEAKQKYADLNSGWILNGPYISVQGAISIVLFKGESPVEGTSKIEPNAEYSWINFS